MAENKQTIRQHEPLRVPQGWTEQARALVIQIERVFDKIFSLLGKRKEKQEPKDDPTASGTAISFIDSISQDENGEITATKKTVRSASASQSGVVTTGEQTFAGVKTFQDDIRQFGAAGTGPMVAVGETDRSLRCYFQIGTGSENHGIYSSGYYDAANDTYTADAKWLVVRNKNGTITVYGNCTGSAGSVEWSNVQNKVNASESEAGIVSTGNQVFAGQKTFTGNIYNKSVFIQANNQQTPGFAIRPLNLGTTNAIIQANAAGTSDNKYGRPQFAFYEYSPSSDGLSRTSYYECYLLPKVDSARSSDGLYDILTTKTAPSFVSFSIPASGSKTFNVGSDFRGVLYIIGGASANQAVITVCSNGSSQVAYQNMGTSSDLTITTGTGTLKIANSRTYAHSCWFMVFRGSVT